MHSPLRIEFPVDSCTHHPHPRRRYRPQHRRSRGQRHQGLRRRHRMGAAGSGPPCHRQIQRPSPAARPRLDLEEQGRPQGAADNPCGLGIPERQRCTPERVRPVREHPAGAIVRGSQVQVRRHRPGDRPREHRGVLRRHRTLYRPRTKRGRNDRDRHALRLRADPQVCLRVRQNPRAEKSHDRAQGEHPEVHGRTVPGRREGNGSRSIPTSRATTRSSTTWRCRWSSTRISSM